MSASDTVTIADAATAKTFTLKAWDPSVYYQEVMRPIVVGQNDRGKDAQDVVQEQDFSVTTKALTTMYTAIASRYDSYFDVENFQPSIPIVRPLQEKQKLYKFTKGNNYPPHLEHKHKLDDDVPSDQIFDATRGDPVATLVRANYNWLTKGFYMLPFTMPNIIKDFIVSKSFNEVETNNAELRSKNTKVWSQPNIGDRSNKDWYTDAVFAQQQFTGTNPKTITLASDQWIQEFKHAAQQQKNSQMVQLVEKAEKGTLYIQDCSYFREAVDIKNDVALMGKGGLFDAGNRYASATVSLFHLDSKGRLHPLSIIIDYKGSVNKSVVIFNKRIDADIKADEFNDWPWRYAKTCAQSADWVRHEIASHLTHTHLVEEVTIVAAHRNIPGDHLLFRLLQPHWYKTLSLNAGARDTLIPNVIIPLMGMTKDQATAFVRYSFQNFSFQGEYIPNDLERRGFPLDQLGDLRCNCDKLCGAEYEGKCTKGCGKDCHQRCSPKFHNYAYARNMKLMWSTLRAYVKAFLAYGDEPGGFTTDQQVEDDTAIQDWCKEIRSRSGGQLETFPVIKTLDALIDAATMCIHIASPQHTAINYLQEYYQSFVVNKPPALCNPLPNTLAQLQRYTEPDLIAALPVARSREWLLACHVPNLLSMRVAEEQNLVNYARSVLSAASWNKEHKPAEKHIAKAAEDFLVAMWVLGDTYDPNDRQQRLKKGVFTKHSEELDDQEHGGYMVMDPVATAVSILI